MKDLKYMFKLSDADDSGELDEDELRQVLRVRSHCRLAPPLIHFIIYSLRESVDLFFLKRQCDRTLQVLYKSNILIEDKHFVTLMNKIDEDGSGTVGARSHCRFVLPLIHIIPDSLR